MPGMNGRILEQRLKTIDPKVRVLLMSGYSDDFFGRDREIG
jgi:YesN/AraC family two-component response regulator